ncbi:MAG: hypothetical protein IPK80_33515 [Nannocystis sp.]|jgi:hypothetical protein|nr:hypothetical protein [Nannocystis sp.]
MSQEEQDAAPEQDEADEAGATVESDESDYGPPFEPKSFGGELVWAQAPGFVAKILRVRAGEIVKVSTNGRKDMFVMLTGGRGVLEIRDLDSAERVELLPAISTPILHGVEYRLIALTEVELMTIYSPGA